MGWVISEKEISADQQAGRWPSLPAILPVLGGGVDLDKARSQFVFIAWKPGHWRVTGRSQDPPPLPFPFILPPPHSPDTRHPVFLLQTPDGSLSLPFPLRTTLASPHRSEVQPHLHIALPDTPENPKVHL